ncbi:MAG TPA: fluoride efflux transporter CrcB [Solirubrobacteraceae bacterium]
MSAWVWIGVALCSGIAAIGRFVLVALISSRVVTGFPGAFPLGTFAVNMTGALLLGLLAGLAVEGDALVLLGTATLGSYTTFSTWMLETQRLAEDGQIAVAAINILLSLVVGLGAIALGRAVGMHL